MCNGFRRNRHTTDAYTACSYSLVESPGESGDLTVLAGFGRAAVLQAAKIRAVAVLPGYERHGVETALLRRAVTTCPRGGCEHRVRPIRHQHSRTGPIQWGNDCGHCSFVSGVV
ncbi:GNAT family N-acetyltransferase [Nocardia nepalensis]|uniref:GNAT family N-acetyltransferase n=1 Tax=Nocardia nepalensis TaxID=3375448 RepID=UPI003B6736BC